MNAPYEILKSKIGTPIRVVLRKGAGFPSTEVIDSGSSLWALQGNLLAFDLRGNVVVSDFSEVWRLGNDIILRPAKKSSARLIRADAILATVSV
jgi:hypothetical protein